MKAKRVKKNHYQFSISEIIIIVLVILLAAFAIVYPQTTGNATQSYKTVNLQHATLDLRSVGISNSNAQVLKISTNSADIVINGSLLSSAQSITTSTVYLYHTTANTLNVFYLNGQTLTSAGSINLNGFNEANPAQLLTTTSQSTGAIYHINLYFRDTTIIRVHVESPTSSNGAAGNIISIWTTSTQTSFSSLGTSANSAENDEVRWKAEGTSAVYIGDQGNDYTTPAGIIIHNTRANSQQEQVSIDLPVSSTQTTPACGNQLCEGSESCEWSQSINTNILCSNNSRIGPGNSCSNCVLSTCGDGICGALETCEWNGGLNRQMLCDGQQSTVPTGGSCNNCAYTSISPIGNCSDTDGGIKRIIKGTVSGIDSSGIAYSNTDICINSTTLTEYSCSGTTPTSLVITCNATIGARCTDGACYTCGNGLCEIGESCEYDGVNNRNFDCSNNATITSTQTCTACILGTSGGSSGGGNSGGGSDGSGGSSGGFIDQTPTDGSAQTDLPPQIGEDTNPTDTPSVCGNFIADNGEDCSNCPQDVQCLSDQICVSGICRTPETETPNSPINYMPFIIIGIFAIVILGGIGAYMYVKKHPKQPKEQPKNLWR